jgi:hypothetical protein
MRSYGWFAAILCALLGACASQPKEPARILMQGFSIAVPNEKDWIVARQGPDLTVIGKPGRYSGESFTMQTVIVTLPSFDSVESLVRQVEAARRKEIDPRQFRLYKLDVTPQKIHAQDCALARADMAERGSAEGTGSPVNTLLETMTLICPHPQNHHRGISMTYAHRHYPEDVDPQFTQDAAALMETLKFEPL